MHASVAKVKGRGNVTDLCSPVALSKGYKAVKCLPEYHTFGDIASLGSLCFSIRLPYSFATFTPDAPALINESGISENSHL